MPKHSCCRTLNGCFQNLDGRDDFLERMDLFDEECLLVSTFELLTAPGPLEVAC